MRYAISTNFRSPLTTLKPTAKACPSCCGSTPRSAVRCLASMSMPNSHMCSMGWSLSIYAAPIRPSWIAIWDGKPQPGSGKYTRSREFSEAVVAQIAAELFCGPQPGGLVCQQAGLCCIRERVSQLLPEKRKLFLPHSLLKAFEKFAFLFADVSRELLAESAEIVPRHIVKTGPTELLP